MFARFLLSNAWVKMGHDLFSTFVHVVLLFYTFNPHSKGTKQKEEPKEAPIGTVNNVIKYKLSEKRCKEIECKLIRLIEKEKLFLDSHITIAQLAQKMGINRNYISETIVRSKHGSFYSLINSYRLTYAQEMLQQNPKLKIEHVAIDSGFSSASVFSQVFKRNSGVPPSTFVKALLSDKDMPSKVSS